MTISFIPKVHANHASGSLDLLERWRLGVALLSARMARRGRRAPRRSLLRELAGPELWQAIQTPRGALASRSWKLACEHQPPWLVNHGLRTHAWAQAFGVFAGLAPDREALFAAAMLHDAGLTPAAATPADHCFAVRGARFAAKALEGAAPRETVGSIAEAIARHLDLQVDLRDGVEAHLLQSGAMADVLGHRMQQVPDELRSRVLTAHPRLSMKAELCLCMAREIGAAPHTRVHCYQRRIDFLNLIRQAPFEESP